MSDSSKNKPMNESDALQIFSEMAAAFPSTLDIGLWTGGNGAEGADAWVLHQRNPNPVADAGLGLCSCCTSFLLPPTSKNADAITSWFTSNGDNLISAIKNLANLMENPPATTNLADGLELPIGLLPLSAASLNILKEQQKLCHHNAESAQTLDQVLAELQHWFSKPHSQGPSKPDPGNK